MSHDGLIALAAAAPAACLAACLAVGAVLAGRLLRPRVFSLAETFAIERDKGYFAHAGFEDLARREVTVASPFGYTLAGTYLPLHGSGKTVILLHGYTYTRHGSAKYLKPFREAGYNALLVDLRGHGASGGRTVTFGHFEARDLAAWMAWVQAENGPGAPVGLHGESLGAAVALQYAALEPRISFVVADCAFSDLGRLLAFRLRADFRLPPFPFLYIAEAAARLLGGGMRVSRIVPLESAAAIGAPVLFIHGEADEFTPASMSLEMFAARAGKPGGIHLAPGAGHARSFAVDPEAYDRLVAGFLGDYVP
ncbi:MAG: alpha/beta hydrolase [Spirochaetaceae bacterium]|nr:alpha/beta hydrolase [Spirochaetaceae bacterium]